MLSRIDNARPIIYQALVMISVAGIRKLISTPPWGKRSLC